MAQEPLYFIQPHVLERLVQGLFVARRQKNKGYKLQDRRDMLSPLNVTRRAVRYEPLVFSNRKLQIIEAVQSLNNPENKLFLISGPSGRGKTAFVRGVVEMMGGGKEQLLWFDVSRHTDFDEVIRFLVEYMTYVCRMDEAARDVPDDPNPIATLDILLRKAADDPVLIVIDNMEFLVAPDQTIRSRELKDAFNFLLAFANVKLVLIGKSLPFSDMNPSAAAVWHLPLEPLSDEASCQTVLEVCPQLAHLSDGLLQALVTPMQGEPLRLTLLAHLLHQGSDAEAWLEALARNPGQPDRLLFQLFYESLSATEKSMLGILSMVRHGAPLSVLKTVFRSCDQSLTPEAMARLGEGNLRLVLKKIYPPQLVLDKLRHRHAENEGQLHIEPYLQLVEAFQELAFHQLSDEQTMAWHGCLEQFYRGEKDKHVLERIYPARTGHLAAEAQYHLSRMRKRRMLPTPLERVSEPPEFSPVLMPELGAERQMMSQQRGQTPPQYSPTMTDEASWAGQTAAPASMMPVMMPYVPPLMASGVTQVQLSQADLEQLATLINQHRGHFDSKHWAQPAEPSPLPEDFTSKSQEAPKGLDFSMPGVTPDLEEQAILDRLTVAMGQNQRGVIAAELLQLGSWRHQRGFAKNAEACWTQALAYAEEAGEVPLVAALHTALGGYHREHFRHNQALSHLRAVIHLAEQAGEPLIPSDILFQSYRELGEIYFYRQHYVQAQDALEQCLTHAGGPTRAVAEVEFRLGLVYDEAGQVAEALRCYQESHETAGRVPAPDLSAVALYNLGSVSLEAGQTDTALEALVACLIYDRDAGYPEDVLRTLGLLSRVHEARQELPQAVIYATEAFQIAETMKHPAAIITAALRLGQLSEQVGQVQKALACYRKVQGVGGPALGGEHRQWITRKLLALEGNESHEPKRSQNPESV